MKKTLYIFTLLVLMSFPLFGNASYDDPAYVDLQGQIVSTSHTDTATILEIGVRTRQQFDYPYNTSIVVGCYDAKQYDIRKTKVASTILGIQGISSTSSVYTTLTIPKKDYVQTILCHIDDTDVVPELNESNRVGRVHVAAKKNTSQPTPQPKNPPPNPPRPQPVPQPPTYNPICREIPVETCKETMYQIKTCATTIKRVCELPPTRPCEQPGDSCDIIELPIVHPQPEDPCKNRRCGKPLPPVNKRPPVKKDPPIYRPAPEDPGYYERDDDGFSDCLGLDCRDDRDYGRDDDDFEHRRIVDPQAIHTEFERMAWLR